MSNGTQRRVFRSVWILASVVVVFLLVATGMRGWTDVAQPPGEDFDHSGSDGRQVAATAQPADRFEVTIRRPSGPPMIELPGTSPGSVGKVSCSTCHSIREPDLAMRKPSDLRQFHQNMSMQHGELACYACHNPSDSDTLRLADGRSVEYADVMDLCAQCHGRHARYYELGFHGGMTGYWDLNRGGRVRNNCIDCHDPHVPAFPVMQPTFKPRDRFLSPHASDGEHHGNDSHG